jgi:hypothetical protein
VAPYNLSVARESVTAVGVGGSLLVAGGWRSMGRYEPTPGGERTVDLFGDPVSGAAPVGLGEGLLSFSLPTLVYMENIYL